MCFYWIFSVLSPEMPLQGVEWLYLGTLFFMFCFDPGLFCKEAYVYL